MTTAGVIATAAAAYAAGLLAYMRIMSGKPRDDSDLEAQAEFMKEYIRQHPDKKFRQRKKGGRDA